jgi:uncharacterized protein
MTHKNNICIITFITWILFAMTNRVEAQISITATTDPLSVNKTKANVNWTLTEPTLWRLGNKNYYKLERKTTHKNGRRLSTPDSLISTNITYIPESSPFWEPYKTIDTVNANTPEKYYATLYKILFKSLQTKSASEEAFLMKRVLKIASLDIDYAVAAGLGFRDIINPRNIYEYSLTIKGDGITKTPNPATVIYKGFNAEDYGMSDRKLAVTYISGHKLIQMKWHTATSQSWVTGKTNGFKITRTEAVTPAGQVKDSDVEFTVQPEPDPTTGSFWTPYKNLNPKTLPKDSTYYYAILYKALYPAVAPANEKERDALWYDAVEAANYSYRIAQKAGFGYQDFTTKDDRKYTYTIKLLPPTSTELDPYTFTTGGTGFEPKPVTTDGSTLGVLAEAKESNKIKLRWVVPSPSAWRKGNTEGYTITRTTTHRNEVAISPEIKTILVEKEAKTSTFWNSYKTLSYSGKNTEADFLSAVYKILYETSVTDRSKEERLLWFNFMSFVNSNFAAASKAGLGYTDLTAKNDEKYTYQISLNGTGHSINPATISIRINTASNPKPKTPKIELGDVIGKKNNSDKYARRTMKISWDIDTLKNIYHSYWVQRKNKNGVFQSVIKESFRNLQKGVRTLYFIDTVEHVRTTYQYQLRGQTFFDSYDSSLVVSVTNKVPLDLSPSIDSVQIIKPKSVKVYWRFPGENNNILQDSLIKGFCVRRSFKADTLYKDDLTVGSSGLISKGQRNVIVANIQEAEYLKIGAIGIEGDTLFTFPRFVELPDDGPPNPPQNARVSFTSTEVKKPIIKWDANTEVDLGGYHVYRQIDGNSDTIQITKTLINVTEFIDTDTLNIDFKSIIYFVQAVDKKGNQSKLSLPAKLEFPDTNPPLPPIFDKYGVKGAGIELSWKNSTKDSDIVKNILFRKSSKEVTWSIVEEFPKDKLIFLDTKVAYGEVYIYMLIAEDKAGLKSKPSVPVEIGMAKSAPIPLFTDFRGSTRLEDKKIQLSWTYVATDLVSFEIYRADENKTLTYWKILNNSEFTTFDEKVQYVKANRYSIRGLFKDGSYSNWQDLTVMFPDACTDADFTVERAESVLFGGKKVVDTACETIILLPGVTIPKPANSSEEYEAVIKKK